MVTSERKRIDILVNTLIGGKNAASKETIIAELVNAGLSAVEPLMRALCEHGRVDPSDYFKGTVILHPAVEVLSKIGEPAIPPLLNALIDENQLIGRRAAETLARIGNPVIKPLIALLVEKASILNDTTLETLLELLTSLEPPPEFLKSIEPLLLAIVLDGTSDQKKEMAKNLLSKLD
ncbi:MAG: HEAT repeat domain-containing protein [Candidatus Odinarchaeota archaeon]